MHLKEKQSKQKLIFGNGEQASQFYFSNSKHKHQPNKSSDFLLVQATQPSYLSLIHLQSSKTITDHCHNPTPGCPSSFASSPTKTRHNRARLPTCGTSSVNPLYANSLNLPDFVRQTRLHLGSKIYLGFLTFIWVSMLYFS